MSLSIATLIGLFLGKEHWSGDSLGRSIRAVWAGDLRVWVADGFVLGKEKALFALIVDRLER